MRIVVTGGRDYTNVARVYQLLDELHGEERIIELVVQGACIKGGADLHAENWAKDREVPYLGVPARWKTGKKGKGEGYVRNALMLNLAKPSLVIAFPGGTGTANCVLQAHKMGIPVREVEDAD